jgi:peptidoglycan/xylan/chitin deacetylase (PgdA/CDA1 family)
MNPAWVSLMYHEVVASDDVPHDHWALAAETFAQQLDWLRDQGYAGDTLEGAIEAEDPRRIGITFDDGYEGQYYHAYRLLAERGMRATFFVTTEWVDTPGFVTWRDLREMSSAGMSIQSHTCSHRFLSTLDEWSLRRELIESKHTLDRELGQDTIALSLPGGDMPRHQLVDLIAEAGYHIVATSEPGLNPPHRFRGAAPWIQRFTVRGGQPFRRFARQVRQNSTHVLVARVRYRALDMARAVLGRQRYHHLRLRFENVMPTLVRRLGA